jgi:hypothetical protein
VPDRLACSGGHGAIQLGLSHRTRSFPKQGFSIED